MRIKFRNLKLQEGVIKVSFDGGYTFQAYNVEDVEEGILLSDSQELDKIRVLGSANLLKNLDVISSIQVDAFCEKINKSVDGDITATGDISAKDGNFTGNVAIGGDLNVAGKVVSIDTETITTKENSIELRHDASIGMVPGDVSGVIINNYDGQGSDAQIALDNAGTLRIGDTGDTEPVATRDEADNMTNDNLVKWDSSDSKLVDAGVGLKDLKDECLIVGFDEFYSRTNTTISDYSSLADIASALHTYCQAQSINEVVMLAQINDATTFAILGINHAWFSGELEIDYLDSSPTAVYNATYSHISMTTGRSLNYTNINGNGWHLKQYYVDTQIASICDPYNWTPQQNMDPGQPFLEGQAGTYVAGDPDGTHFVIGPNKTIWKMGKYRNFSSVDVTHGGYNFGGAYHFSGLLQIPTSAPTFDGCTTKAQAEADNPQVLSTIPAGTIWINP